MDILLSGQVGGALTLQKRNTFYGVDGTVVEGLHATQIASVFAGCTDVRQVRVTAEKDARILARVAWQQDRALRLLLMSLDASETLEDRTECAACVESLFSQQEIFDFVQRAMYADVFPERVDRERALAHLRSDGPVRRLLQDVFQKQSAIGRVAKAFENLPTGLFETQTSRTAFRDQLILDGAYFELATTVYAGESAEFLYLQLVNRYRAVPNSREILRSWLSEFLKKNTRVESPKSAQDFEPYEDDLDEPSERARQRKAGGRRAYENVIQQQRAIIEKLKLRDLDEARKFASQLVQSQAVSSTSEQMAKSLSKLSQEANRLGVPELHLEWSEWATRVNPTDPRTHGHFADALISIGRLKEASDALEEVRKYGDEEYAANGYARILRERGDLIEARALFLQAARKFGSMHSFLGAAEVLREMGHLNEALAEYSAITERWPLESYAWIGLAAAYLDMGRFQDAIMTFGIAEQYSSDSVVPILGRANAYKLSGNLSKAMELAELALQESPNNQVALICKADVLRLQGRDQSALRAYRNAIARSPFSPNAYAGYAELLSNLGKVDEAQLVYNNAYVKFPFNRRIALGRVKLAKRSHELQHALRLIDHTIERFPYDAMLRTARADLLSKLSMPEEALAAYDQIFQEWPEFDPAVRGKAALLIFLGRFDEAQVLLPNEEPVGQDGWARFVLRALLFQKQGNLADAERLLQSGLGQVPFAKERRILKGAFATLQLEQKRYSEAARSAEETGVSDIANVIRFHAAAAVKKRHRATRLYKLISTAKPEPRIIELTREIAKRHKLIPGRPAHSTGWIAHAEIQEILLEAA